MGLRKKVSGGGVQSLGYRENSTFYHNYVKSGREALILVTDDAFAFHFLHSLYHILKLDSASLGFPGGTSG